jgi:hypothetical protein
VLADISQDDTNMTEANLPRREALRRLMGYAAVGLMPTSLHACGRDPETATTSDTGRSTDTTVGYPPPSPEDEFRLLTWVNTLRAEGLAEAGVPLGSAAIRVGELALGTPYEAYTLEEYLRAGGSPSRTEPLTLSLTRFDCVSLLEACLATARVARAAEAPTWDGFGREMERMRYRGGVREGYVSRLHYFSEWISDGEARGLVRSLGAELNGVRDERPLRFMSSNPGAYPAMATPEVAQAVAAMERSLDSNPRWVVPTTRIPEVVDELESGDILAFATSIEGLDVTHAAFAYESPDGVMRVLHAPLSGGVVEITTSTVHEYVTAIRRATGILIARPLQ